MKSLTLGQHFGESKRKIKFNNLIISEAVIAPNSHVPWHYHENAYFLYSVKGNFMEVNKKEKIQCSRNTLLYHNWQEPHYNESISEGVNYFHIEIEKKWFSQKELNPDIIEGSINIHHPEIKSLFQNIYKELNVQDAVTPIAIEGMLLQAFALLQRDTQKITLGHTPKWVNRLQEIIADSYDVNQLDLQQLAEQIGISAVHLSRTFPRYFGEDLSRFIRRRKIELSRELLDQGELSNASIAYQCGFADESHFIKTFKNYYGMTPGDYKKQTAKEYKNRL
ncbi:helix-turn-helix domain-containing protein [Sphingobacterium paucimobilis]|uniref:HTH araC/xylS-type domain-containing protein n=1 Tax=Sphingobacterium paucimobilis HER1398 TaxID=1346330 RepID=U2HBK7_9SPHI|nr:AraC family transcriptional regulator [Sphingobacterium paucimobilis]ERJ59121.1 hypothetical protein M472_10085 [Sphingobacterium paucimobilis HER1398]